MRGIVVKTCIPSSMYALSLHSPTGHNRWCRPSAKAPVMLGHCRTIVQTKASVSFFLSFAVSLTTILTCHRSLSPFFCLYFFTHSTLFTFLSSQCLSVFPLSLYLVSGIAVVVSTSLPLDPYLLAPVPREWGEKAIESLSASPGPPLYQAK